MEWLNKYLYMQTRSDSVFLVTFSTGQWAGLRVVSVLPESVAAVAKQLKQPEPLVRAKAAFALRALVDGAGGVGSSVHGEALKAAVRAAADRQGHGDGAAAGFAIRIHRLYYCESVVAGSVDHHSVESIIFRSNYCRAAVAR